MNVLPLHPRAHVLLVEDSPEDVILTAEAFEATGIDTELHVAGNTDEAMEIIRSRRGAIDLILLDLNLPKRGGRDFLSDMKHTADLRRIPIVVLTTSRSEADVLDAYDRHVNSYIKKPVDLDEFFEAIQAIAEHWLRVVTRPPYRRTA